MVCKTAEAAKVGKKNTVFLFPENQVKNSGQNYCSMGHLGTKQVLGSLQWGNAGSFPGQAHWHWGH